MRGSPSPIERWHQSNFKRDLSTGRSTLKRRQPLYYRSYHHLRHQLRPQLHLLTASPFTAAIPNSMNNRPPRAYPVIIGILPFLLLFVGVAICLPPTLTNPLSVEYSLSADSSSSNADAAKPLLRKPSNDRLLPIAWLMSFPVSNAC